MYDDVTSKFIRALLKYIPGFENAVDGAGDSAFKFSSVVDKVSSYVSGVFDSLTPQFYGFTTCDCIRDARQNMHSG